MSINSLYYELLAIEYAKIKCPICGKSPSLVVLSRDKFYTRSCGHPEVELLTEEADRKCIASLNAGMPRSVRFVPPSEK